MPSPEINGMIAYDPSSGFYVYSGTGEKMTQDQAQRLADSVRAEEARQIAARPAQRQAELNQYGDGSGIDGGAMYAAQGLFSGYNPQSGVVPTTQYNGQTYTADQLLALATGGNTLGSMAPDARAYFERYPDLLPAYQANSYGMNPDQFAQAHYNNFGQGEQRVWGVQAQSPLPQQQQNQVYQTQTPNQVYQTQTPTQEVLSPIRAAVADAPIYGQAPYYPDYGVSGGMVGGTPSTPNWWTPMTNGTATTPNTPWNSTQPTAPAHGGLAMDSSAWRAAPTALTALQQGGRGMLYS